MPEIQRITIPQKVTGDSLTADEFNQLSLVTDALAAEVIAQGDSNEPSVRLLAAMAGEQLYVIDLEVG
jgi:hypothetical protein